MPYQFPQGALIDALKYKKQRDAYNPNYELSKSVAAGGMAGIQQGITQRAEQRNRAAETFQKVLTNNNVRAYKINEAGQPEDLTMNDILDASESIQRGIKPNNIKFQRITTQQKQLNPLITINKATGEPTQHPDMLVSGSNVQTYGFDENKGTSGNAPITEADRLVSKLQANLNNLRQQRNELLKYSGSEFDNKRMLIEEQMREAQNQINRLTGLPTTEIRQTQTPVPLGIGGQVQGAMSKLPIVGRFIPPPKQEFKTTSEEYLQYPTTNPIALRVQELRQQGMDDNMIAQFLQQKGLNPIEFLR